MLTQARGKLITDDLLNIEIELSMVEVGDVSINAVLDYALFKWTVIVLCQIT